MLATCNEVPRGGGIRVQLSNQGFRAWAVTLHRAAGKRREIPKKKLATQVTDRSTLGAYRVYDFGVHRSISTVLAGIV